MSLPGELARLPQALHALDAPPAADGWNLAELEGVLPAGARMREAAVLVGLVPREHGPGVILTRRTDALRHHAGQVSFPGGRIEPGDGGALDAALREADEEIGLRSSLVTPVGWLDPLATITSFRVLPVVARVSPDFVARPDPDEVADVFEVPLAFLLSRENLGHFEIEAGGRMRRVLEYRPWASPPQRIWGATASILFNLRERLERLP